MTLWLAEGAGAPLQVSRLLFGRLGRPAVITALPCISSFKCFPFVGIEGLRSMTDYISIDGNLQG